MNEKLKHFQTVICPEALYAAEYFNMTKRGQEDSTDRKKNSREDSGTPNDRVLLMKEKQPKIYLKMENISYTIRKRRYSSDIFIQNGPRATDQLDNKVL